MTPDWSAKPQGVPYAVLDDPQSLNLYSYVRNNPLSKTDPNGHCTVDGEKHGSTWCWLHKHNLFGVETQHERAQDLRKQMSQLGIYQNGKKVDWNKLSDKDVFQTAQTFFTAYLSGRVLSLNLAGAAILAAPNVTNPELQRIVDELYQPSDKIPGGTAGAVRYERETGELLSPKGHEQEARELIKRLDNFLQKNPGISTMTRRQQKL